MTRGAILVISESASDAEVVVDVLKREFPSVTASSEPDRFPRRFDSLRPDVLVLCMQSTRAAEHHYLGILRRSPTSHQKLHRTIVLCKQEEVARAYHLCKEQYFDDYVLFWPVGNDAHRLGLSVYQALRHVSAAEAGEIEDRVFASRVKSLGERKESDETPDRTEARSPDSAAETKAESDVPLIHLVDDDRLQHKLMRHVLEGSGYRFSGSMSGDDFVAQLRSGLPSVVLMDFEMPGTDGIALTRRIREDERTSHIPVLMVTGHSTREVAFASLEAGAVDFVVKPFKREVILRKIERCLSNGESALPD